VAFFSLQTWYDNMSRKDEPTITPSVEHDFTRITFEPDLKRFQMTRLDDDIIFLFMRRAHDIAGCARDVSVFWNGEQLSVAGFESYVTKYLSDIDEQHDKLVYERPNERWEVALAPSTAGVFQQVSFVNNVATLKGGSHVNHVLSKIVDKLTGEVQQKLGTTLTKQLRPLHVCCSVCTISQNSHFAGEK
jgi:DNA topoisomerase-2